MYGTMNKQGFLLLLVKKNHSAGELKNRQVRFIS